MADVGEEVSLVENKKRHRTIRVFVKETDGKQPARNLHL